MCLYVLIKLNYLLSTDVQSVEFGNNLSDPSQSIATRTAMLQIPSTQESHNLQKYEIYSIFINFLIRFFIKIDIYINLFVDVM